MKKKDNLIISVGIPAYNEEQSINHLVKSLLTQIEDGFELKEIIILSDESPQSIAL